MRTLFILLGLSLLVSPVDGQTIWSRPYQPNQITVEAMFPDLPEEASFPAGASYLTGTVSLSDNLELAAELPAARYVPSSEVDSAAHSAVGNPYVGVGVSSTTLPFMVEVGLRLPVASASPALPIGATSDLGRTQAFTREEFSVSVLPNVRAMLGRRTSLRVRSGLTYASFPVVNEAGEERNERDWRLLYSAQLWREGDTLIQGLGITGRSLLTAPGSFRTNSRHHLVGSLMGHWNVVQPGLLFGLALNDLPDEAPFLFGLTVSVSLGR